MPPITKTGPYSALPPETRRQGRGGHSFSAGNPGLPAGSFLGNVTAVQWSVVADQVDVLIPGSWRNSQIPGAEARAGSITYQDVDDYYRMLVFNFFEARRQGDFGATAPIFNVNTTLAGGVKLSSWSLHQCRLYSYDGGYSNSDDVMERELAMSFDDDGPTAAFQFTSGGGTTDYVLPTPTP